MKSMSKITRGILEGGGVLVLVFALAAYAAAQSVTLISNDAKLTDPGALTTDGTNLFVGNGDRIFVVPIGGGAATELPATVARNLYPSPIFVYGLTRLGSSLFWIDPNGDPDATAIFKVSTSGGAVTKIYSGFATGQPIVDGVGIATDGTKLYTTDEVQGRVHSLNPDGSSIIQLGSRYGGYFYGEQFNALAVSGGTIFIVDPSDSGVWPTPPVLVSIPVTGGSFTTMVMGSPLVNPRAVAVGNGKIFIADPGAGNTIWQVPIGGGKPTALVSGVPFVQLSANGLIFFNNALYVSDNGNLGTMNGRGAIYRVDFTVPPDPTPPVISSVSANPNVLWPPNHKMVPVTMGVSVADVCSPSVRSSCRIISVSSNEPVDGLGDGDLAPDWVITGNLTVNLRAERSGTGSGRVYTITVRCTDASWNSSTKTVAVTVPRDQRK